MNEAFADYLIDCDVCSEEDRTGCPSCWKCDGCNPNDRAPHQECNQCKNEGNDL